MKSGRVFGASLKPAWNMIKIEAFLKQMQDTAIVYIINHDKDINDDGTLKEKHTHVYIEYPTPRKITTVSNLLEVEDNFIEVIKNKKGYLRYLTHKDDDNKYQYNDDEVYTNDIDYSTKIMGSSITDKEIAEYLQNGKGIELLGVVSASRLRTIQSFMHFDTSNKTLQAIRELNDRFEMMTQKLKVIEDMALDFTETFADSVDGLTGGLIQVATEIAKVRNKAIAKRK